MEMCSPEAGCQFAHRTVPPAGTPDPNFVLFLTVWAFSLERGAVCQEIWPSGADFLCSENDILPVHLSVGDTDSREEGTPVGSAPWWQSVGGFWWEPHSSLGSARAYDRFSAQ